MVNPAAAVEHGIVFLSPIQTLLRWNSEWIVAQHALSNGNFMHSKKKNRRIFPWYLYWSHWKFYFKSNLRAFFNIKKREQEKPIHFSFQNKLQGWKMYLEITWSEVKWSESRSVMSDSLRPHGLYSPQNSPGQNTGVGSHSLLQGIFPTQGLNSGLPQVDSLPAEPPGKPLHSKGNHKQNEKTICRMKENIYKWCDWQGFIS